MPENTHQLKTITLFDIPMHSISMRETVSWIQKRIKNSQFTQHCVVNVAKLVNSQTDNTLKSSVTDCDLINIDGMGVVFAARYLGYHVPERVAGIDLFLELIKMSEQQQYPVYLLGAKQEVVEQTQQHLQAVYPDLVIAGYHHGYFWDDEKTVVNAIRDSGARLLFVAITSPRKENFINRWKQELGVDFVMGVGGSFDVISGNIARAPQWMQKIGMEWLFRVVQEPRRMWKRYLFSNLAFARMIIHERINQIKKNKVR